MKNYISPWELSLVFLAVLFAIFMLIVMQTPYISDIAIRNWSICIFLTSLGLGHGIAFMVSSVEPKESIKAKIARLQKEIEELQDSL